MNEVAQWRASLGGLASPLVVADADDDRLASGMQRSRTVRL